MIVAGFGFRKAAQSTAFWDAYALARARAAVLNAELLCVPSEKANAPCFYAFAEALGLRVLPVEADHMHKICTQSQGRASMARFGVGSVAEAVAMVGAGARAHLLIARVVSPDGMATCALAEGEGI